MPVVTRYQSKIARDDASKKRTYESAYNQLIGEMRILVQSFTNDTTALERTAILRDFIIRMNPLLESAALHVSQDTTLRKLKLMTVLHNRMLYMSTEVNAYDENAAGVVYDFAVQLARHMEKHFKNMIIMYNYQSRIAGYTISQDKYIDFSEITYSK
jgi:hypothetical protein